MVKEIVKPKFGCEKLVELFDEAIANSERDESLEIESAIAVIKAKHEQIRAHYVADRLHYIDVELVEVPDEVAEVEPVAENEIKVDGEEVVKGEQDE